MLLLAHISSGADPVYVSKALQKAKIVVNEDGTKAAAATSECLCMRFKERATKKKIFRSVHPLRIRVNLLITTFYVHVLHVKGSVNSQDSFAKLVILVVLFLFDPHPT